MAAAQSRSPNTQALIKAIRTNGFFPQPSWRAATNDVATVTVPAAGAASTIAGNTAIGIADRTKISWLSGTADKDVNLTYASRGAWYVGGANHQLFEL